jgi:hypothetical protein
MEMDATGVALIITSLGGFVASVGAVVVSIRNSAKQDKTNEKLEEVHKATNGLTERLERSAREEGRQIGKQQGVAQQVADDSLVAKGKLAGTDSASITGLQPPGTVGAEPIDVRINKPDKD